MSLIVSEVQSNHNTLLALPPQLRSLPKTRNDQDKVESISIFQCTWCRQGFRRAYDWQRHEESQHAPQTEWICIYTTDPVNSTISVCYEAHPDGQHNETQHNALSCLQKPIKERSFDRKDHLMQHLKQVHPLNTFLPQMIHWRRELPGAAPEEGWICGFCHRTFPDWPSRVEHIKQHFKSGLDMSGWDLSQDALKGSRWRFSLSHQHSILDPGLTERLQRSFGCLKCRK